MPLRYTRLYSLLQLAVGLPSTGISSCASRGLKLLLIPVYWHVLLSRVLKSPRKSRKSEVIKGKAITRFKIAE